MRLSFIFIYYVIPSFEFIEIYNLLRTKFLHLVKLYKLIIFLANFQLDIVYVYKSIQGQVAGIRAACVVFVRPFNMPIFYNFKFVYVLQLCLYTDEFSFISFFKVVYFP